MCGQMVTNKSPIFYTLEDTKPDGSSPCICGFILADYARDLMDLTPDERWDNWDIILIPSTVGEGWLGP